MGSFGMGLWRLVSLSIMGVQWGGLRDLSTKDLDDKLIFALDLLKFGAQIEIEIFCM